MPHNHFIFMPLIDISWSLNYIISWSTFSCKLKARAGVPLEVMGLMLGEIIDDYTVKVVDVFAMPQSGTGVSTL